MEFDTTTTNEVRKENLRLLTAYPAVLSRLSRKLEVGKAGLRELADRGSRKPVSAGLARRIEAGLGLMDGWMDIPHDYLSDEARSFAKKWSILPASIRLQINEMMDYQIRHLRKAHPETQGDKALRTRLHRIYDSGR